MKSLAEMMGEWEAINKTIEAEYVSNRLEYSPQDSNHYIMQALKEAVEVIKYADAGTEWDNTYNDWLRKYGFGEGGKGE